MFCEFLMYFFVFATYVFYCFFIWNCWVLNINKYNSDFNCNESKYCILELKMEFWHKKPFSICFVHKSRKFSNFEPTLDYIMLCNFGTVHPIFPKIKFHKIIARNVEGGGGRIPPPPPPPPPALLGLNGQVNTAWALGSKASPRRLFKLSACLLEPLNPHLR